MKRRTTWIIIGIIALALIIYALSSSWSPSTENPDEETLSPAAGSPSVSSSPIATFDVQSIDELRAYTLNKPIPPIESNRVVPAMTDDDHVWGDADTDFSIIEYANIQNHYTLLMHPELKSLVERHSGTMNWIFRHYPLPENELDYAAAQASECIARDNGNNDFWRFLDTVLAEQNLTESRLYEIGASVGASDLETCVSSNSTQGLALLDKQDAQLMANVFVSPSFFIRNNQTGELRFVEGANHPDYLESVLAAMR